MLDDDNDEMIMTDLSLTSQLLFLQLFAQPFFLLDQVQLLLLQVDDCLLGQLQPPQDLLNISFLLAGPIISELGQFLYLGYDRVITENIYSNHFH